MEFKAFRAVLSFLTVLPAGSYDIYTAARGMYLFPLVGAAVGVIVGGMAFGLSFFLHPLIVGLLATGALVIITGVHHTDALADFADGLMAKGGKEAKHKAMLDPAVGSAGVATLVLYFAGMIIVFYTGLSPGPKVFFSLVTAEAIAKYSMVLLANRGASAWQGFSSPFTSAMKSGKKLLAATAITLPIAWFATGQAGLIALSVSIAISLMMLYMSNRNFGGISGDVLGASNEITRLASLVVISSSTVAVL